MAANAGNLVSKHPRFSDSVRLGIQLQIGGKRGRPAVAYLWNLTYRYQTHWHTLSTRLAPLDDTYSILCDDESFKKKKKSDVIVA